MKRDDHGSICFDDMPENNKHDLPSKNITLCTIKRWTRSGEAINEVPKPQAARSIRKATIKITGRKAV